MRFEEKQLVRFASASTRQAFLDQASLEALADAAYVLAPGTLSPPWSAAFDRVELGASFGEKQSARIEARWDAGGMRADGSIEVDRRAGEARGIEAIWRGAVIGRGRIGGGRVSEVAGSFPGLGAVDANIDARPAPPPAFGPARETARIAEVARILSSAAGRADAFSEAMISAWMTETGSGDVATFLARGVASTAGGGFRVRFESAAPAVEAPVRLEIVAAILIRDPGEFAFSLAGLLRETRLAQDLIAAEIRPAAPTPGTTRRVPVPVIWVVPNSWFDDADWPGASPAARRAEAARWLRELGIAIAAMPVN